MDNKQVEDCTVFLTVAGSRAYGTNTKDSDYDYRGVCIVPDLSYYIGMGINVFEQKDKGWEEDDRVVYDIRKVFKLMSNANPSILELLFVREEDHIHNTTYWKTVQGFRDKFLSKKVRFTYGGYAYAQLKRIQRHRGYLMSPPGKKPERKDFNLPEKNLISSDQMGAFQWLLANMLEESIEMMRLSDETKRELRGINYVGVVQSKIPDNCYQVVKEITGATDEWVDAIMREKRYKNALNSWDAYRKWKKERNPKRQKIEAKYGFDTKHATHLVRLMRMGIEILQEGKLLVYRPDREELLSIRNGAWTYDQVVEFAEESDKRLIELYKTSSLPKQPDRKFLDKLCQDVIRGYLDI